tara:strand:+ start:2124 stop:2438 length:315 start_codon:yes stop_codon:yes gene_type:complete
MFPKGMGNMMKQAQQMQKKMKDLQNQLEDLDVEGVSGGGMVKVVVSGKKDIKSLKINPDVMSEDVDMLEDLILAAIKKAQENADKESKDKMGSLTGGMNIPGLF